ncbi:disulfide bond formation protein DsbA [Sphingobium cupriresistens]|uniref:Disulfide bond formation protein DsbA n=2 Tax=Sphingobium cupriresistens TaxID=1132417 RepID=A0A8G2DXK8_9SPHN|nr:disulfide bond formation protein DsbA [Sphingobium cupriresistens]
MTGKRRLSRRELLQLSGMIGIGYGASVYLRATAPLGIDVSTNTTAQALLHDPGGPMEGPEDADLRVVVFTDYQCPACRRAAPELDSAMREDGRIEVAYKDWPIFGDTSKQAARVALASEPQGLYFEIHHALMREHGTLTEALLRAIVERMGANWARLTGDLQAGRDRIQTALALNATHAFALGIAGTPAFLVGPLLVKGALSRSEFAKAFSDARAELHG